MAPENFDVFRNISKIIERDSKTSTYKFALLRGTIAIVQENSPFIRLEADRVHIPLGCMMERWMVYYYPILESATPIPQIHGTANLAFGPALRDIIDYYRPLGGFSAFYNDLRNKGIPEAIRPKFLELADKLRRTIADMPMKYLGRSISNEFYSVFRKETSGRPWRSGPVDIQRMIEHSGTFSIPLDYFHAFQVLGSFIGGEDSILFKWAEFSANHGAKMPVETVLHNVLRSPVTQRDIESSKRLYRDLLRANGSVHCVWTGNTITTYDVDHMIPFSVWKNNDLWNLLPSSSAVNNQKRDKIPSTVMLEASQTRIQHYWEVVFNAHPERFRKELQVSLLGHRSFEHWQHEAFGQLQVSCDSLIKNRGFQPWQV
jgi:hypothetical protein